MMNYEMFKKAVEDQFMSYMSDCITDLTISVIPVKKVNTTLDGMLIKCSDKNFSPTIYINDLYEDYLMCGDFDKTLLAACDRLQSMYSEMGDINLNNILNNASEKIIFQVINTEMNIDLLMSLPHRNFLDLSIIYRLIVNEDVNGIHSAKITNELAEMIGMNESQLYQSAFNNTKRLFPSFVRNLSDVVRQSLIEDGVPDEVIDGLISDNIPIPMFVITNTKNINGAAAILYDDVLHELANNLESDLYLFPSSIHDIVAIPAEGDPDELSSMVADINRTQVCTQERLSDNVYFYNRKDGKVSIANTR